MPDMDHSSYFLRGRTATSGDVLCASRQRRWCYRPGVVRRCWVLAVLLSCLLQGCEAQGRLVDPPSRASMWRYDFSNPVDFNDDRVDCGGFKRQWRKNQGRCGVCGDPWDLPEPRPHETRGGYGRGIIVRNYTQGQAVVVEVEVTAANSGHFEYQVCPRASVWIQETPDCFTHALKDDFERNQIPVNVTQKFARLRHVLRLPGDLSCLACILQWKYITGGRAGREEYRACADITITPTTTAEPNTTTTTSTTTTIATTITTTTDPDTETTEDTTTSPTTLSSLAVTETSSKVPDINLGYTKATNKPKVRSGGAQVAASPANTRMNDLMQKDSSDERGNCGVSNLPVTLYYGITFSVVILRCKHYI